VTPACAAPGPPRPVSVTTEEHRQASLDGGCATSSVSTRSRPTADVGRWLYVLVRALVLVGLGTCRRTRFARSSPRLLPGPMWEGGPRRAVSLWHQRSRSHSRTAGRGSRLLPVVMYGCSRVGTWWRRLLSAWSSIPRPLTPSRPGAAPDHAMLGYTCWSRCWCGSGRSAASEPFRSDPLPDSLPVIAAAASAGARRLPHSPGPRQVPEPRHPRGVKGGRRPPRSIAQRRVSALDAGRAPGHSRIGGRARPEPRR
jgi:hypothetical protein